MRPGFNTFGQGFKHAYELVLSAGLFCRSRGLDGINRLDIAQAGGQRSYALAQIGAFFRMHRRSCKFMINIKRALDIALFGQHFSHGTRAQRKTLFSFVRIFPWFVLGFLAMALLNSFGVLGATAPRFSLAGKLLITVALAGVGLGANLRKIVRTGPRPILLGLVVWVAVALISLGVQSVYNQL